jgi:hypothetical protein
MPSEDSAVKCACLSVAIVIILVLAYQLWDGQCLNKAPAAKTENMSLRPPAKANGGKKKGFSEGELETFLNTRHGEEPAVGYDPASIGLEQSVIDSHREFTDEAYNSATGANATDSVRDDTNEVNVRWGLRRVDYESTFSSDDARTVSSEDPEQVQQKHGNYTL